jgi:hypothetical protein
LIFLSPGLQAEDDGTEITVEGYAAQRDNLVKARDEAVLDAIRRGVEQVLGGYIDSRTILHNFNLIEDSVLSKTRGYVSNYSIIDERKDRNMLVVIVKMTVKEEDIEDDLQAIKLAIQQRGNPRVAVAIPEIDGNNLRPSPVETKIIQKLSSSGFEIVSRDIYDNSQQLSLLHEIIGGSTQYVLDLGNWFDTTYLVVGESKPEFINEYQGLITYSYQSKVEVLNADLSHVISSHSENEKGVHIKSDQAILEAADQTGKIIAEQVFNKLAEDVSASGHTIRVILNGSDFSELEFLKRRLKAIRLTERVFMRSFENNTITFDVVTGLPTYNFAEALNWWDLDLAIEKVSSNIIRASFED